MQTRQHIRTDRGGDYRPHHTADCRGGATPIGIATVTGSRSAPRGATAAQRTPAGRAPRATEPARGVRHRTRTPPMGSSTRSGIYITVGHQHIPRLASPARRAAPHEHREMQHNSHEQHPCSGGAYGSSPFPGSPHRLDNWHPRQLECAARLLFHPVAPSVSSARHCSFDVAVFLPCAYHGLATHHRILGLAAIMDNSAISAPCACKCECTSSTPAPLSPLPTPRCASARTTILPPSTSHRNLYPSSYPQPALTSC